MAELTKPMLNCVAFMKERGGTIERHTGGFWSYPGWRLHDGGQWFGTSTVNALVIRGVATYTEYKNGRSGRFPIKCTLSEEEQHE